MSRAGIETRGEPPLHDPVPDGCSYPNNRCTSTHAVRIAGRNVTVRCTYSAGHWSHATEIAVPHQWRKVQWDGPHLDACERAGS